MCVRLAYSNAIVGTNALAGSRGDRVTATRIDSGLRPIPDPSEVRRDENHPPDHGRDGARVLPGSDDRHDGRREVHLAQRRGPDADGCGAGKRVQHLRRSHLRADRVGHHAHPRAAGWLVAAGGDGARGLRGLQVPAGSEPAGLQRGVRPEHGGGPPLRARGRWHRRGYRAEDPDLHVGQPHRDPGGPIEQPTDFDPTVIEYIYTSVPFAQTISPAAPVGATLAIKPPAVRRFASSPSSPARRRRPTSWHRSTPSPDSR